MKYLISLCLVAFLYSSAFAQHTIEEFIFDGVSSSPDVQEQGMDMHSFYDGDFIWYAYHDYTDQLADSNFLLRYSPKTGKLKIIQLEDSTTTGEDVPVAYQAIQGLDSDTIFVYASYGTRAIWEYSKSTGVSTYTEFAYDLGGGGKITTGLVGGKEALFFTATFGGPPVLFNTDGSKTTAYPEITLGAYGVQTDANNNYFMSDWTNDEIKAISFDASHVASIVSSDASQAIDIALDGEFIWGGSRIIGDTNVIEKFAITYDGGGLVTSIDLVETIQTGFPFQTLCASIKANDEYVAAAWEGQTNGTLGWSILTKSTGKWEHFYNMAQSATVPASVYPYTNQYWTTVTIEIDVAGEIYITGYSPENAGGYMQTGSCPEHSMRMLKFTMNGSILSDGILSDGIIY